MTEQREPVAAVVGDALVVRLDVVARVLARTLRAQREQARINGLPFPDELAELLVLAELADAKLAARGSAGGTAPVPLLGASGSARPQSTYDRSPPLSVVEVARLAGVSERAVRKAAHVRRLAGRIRAGRWEFDPTAVEDWNARRRRP